jgi:tRNA modification GTPase
MQGSFSNWLNQIEQQLIKCLVLTEASFEFIDDEIEFAPQILSIIEEITNQIQTNKKVFNKQQQIKEGIKIAIIGSVNAGKSSLFNALLKRNRAIVSDIAGTTRDSIEAGIYTNNHYMTIIDTAGLRQTSDVIEQEGIKRSMEEAQKADIILLVIDGSRNLTTPELEAYNQIISSFRSKIMLIINKVDIEKNNKTLSHFNDLQIIEISTKTNKNIDFLEKQIEEKINQLLESSDSPFLLNKRQFNLLSDLENKLIEIKQMLQGKVEYELLSIHINEALQAISELTGKSIAEKGMDAIFKEFCVGK